MAPLTEAGLPETLRVSFEDGAATTVHVGRYARADFTAKVVRLDPAQALSAWALANGVVDAIVGGFFIRAEGTPLGELRLGGLDQPSQAFDAPWDGTRACLHIDGDAVICARRDQLGIDPGGDLLQAGPMLVASGISCVAEGAEQEGFSAGAGQFDSDITLGRFPRAALGVTESALIAVVCDGRSDSDAGMSLAEVADTMIELGADDAINLDGGGSASLLVGGELANVPREEHGIALIGGRAISTAITFRRR